MSPKFVTNSIVIPGKLAIASATRNPGKGGFKTRPYKPAFRGHDGGKATDFFLRTSGSGHERATTTAARTGRAGVAVIADGNGPF